MLRSADRSRVGPPDACAEIGETRNTTDLGKAGVCLETEVSFKVTHFPRNQVRSGIN